MEYFRFLKEINGNKVMTIYHFTFLFGCCILPYISGQHLEMPTCAKEGKK